jgi:hypothetical protein
MPILSNGGIANGVVHASSSGFLPAGFARAAIALPFFAAAGLVFLPAADALPFAMLDALRFGASRRKVDF